MANWFHRHTFGNWEVIQRNKITLVDEFWGNGKTPVGWRLVILQQRRCQACGYTQTDKQETTW